MNAISSYFSSATGQRTLNIVGMMLAIMAFMGAKMALAAGGDATFEDALTMITAWAEGSLGKLTAVAFLIVGIAMGIMRQSIIAAVPAVAAALALAIGPGILDGVFTAGLPL